MMNNINVCKSSLSCLLVSSEYCAVFLVLIIQKIKKCESDLRSACSVLSLAVCRQNNFAMVKNQTHDVCIFSTAFLCNFITLRLVEARCRSEML